MARKAKPELPVAPLPDLMRWWKAQAAPGVVIGGLAVALLGRPRMTRDIDGLILLPEVRWPVFLTAASAFGFVPRLPEAIAFAHEARVLLLRHQRTDIDIDISFGCLPFEEETVARATLVRIGRVSVPLATPEDLVIMKAIAHRDRDLVDIDGLLAAHPDLDLRRVRRWVRAFAETLETPELYDDLQWRVKHRPPRKRDK